MARTKRGFLEGGIYHILNRGNGKQTVFLKDGDYEAFVDLLKESQKRFDFKLYAFCIMPNHFHFVVECSKLEQFSPWMQWLTTAHARRYHKHYGGSGHVWQGRFKSFLIHSDEYLLTVLRYVEANPKRAGLVDTAVLWQWSSFRERIGLHTKGLLDKPPLALPADWGGWVNRPIGEAELKVVQGSVEKQTPYGPSSWQKEICRRLGIESTLRLRGRPPKGVSHHSPKKVTDPFI
jgi:putative transposase